MKILAIDDNRDNLTALKAVVADRLPATRLLTAPDGPRGLELALAEDPDVILLDIVMPGMDGYAVCRKLKQDERLQNIPVVFLTALRTDRDSRVKALEVGAEGFISKPFDEIELIAQIQAMAKIKAANRLQRLEKEQLAALVTERTRELEQELAERRQAEQERETTEEKYRTLVENIPQKIFTKDRRSVYVSCNQNFARDLGITPAEIAGKTDYDFFPEELADKYRSDDQRLMASGKTEGIEEQYIQGGEKVWVYTVKSPVRDNDGNTVGILGVFSDITERKLAEAERERLRTQLQQAQKMEAIGTLAGGIAHDFNNILSIILGYAELARREIGEQSKAGKDLQQVITACKRAADLVRQILTISRQSEQQRQTVKIQHIIREALKLLRPSISTLIEIRSVIDPGCPEVMADPTEVLQVIMNLCTNAYHAMGELARDDHVLEIRLAPVDLDATMVLDLGLSISPGQYVELSISDTGCGMDTQTMAKIFEPYFTTKKKGQGTGLGLAMVQGIVARSGGAITVASKTGQGTTFRVFFPVHEGDTPVSKQKKVDQAAAGGAERIMVIDDEEAIAQLLLRMLAPLGYQVTALSSCEEAMRIFNERPTAFDLIITDLNMPKVMGTDLARAFLETRPDIPIILCTGFSEKFDSEQIKAIGIREFLYKPVNSEFLARVVRKILDKK